MPITPELQRIIDGVVAKRPRTVIDHIVKHGLITTDELKELYGYNHPPRAARDVREWGIPLETIQVKGPDGRSIAAYRLGDINQIDSRKIGGRRAFPKALKQQLVVRDGERCSLCEAMYPPGALQVDHRVPYEVAGDVLGQEDAVHFILVCGSCNRAKSWSCEACSNWIEIKDASLCETCFWAVPSNFTHIAMTDRRELTVTWDGREIQDYEGLKIAAAKAGMNISDFAKDTLKRSL